MGWEERVVGALALPPWDALVPLAGALYLLGTTWGWWALVALLALRRRWELAMPLLAALLPTDALVWVLKEAVARPRPDAALFAGSDWAFPSGHTARAAAAAGLAWVLGLPAAWRWAAVGFALLMGASRLLALAHWPTDVLAGLVLGAAVGAGVAGAWRRDAAGLRTRALALPAQARAALRR